MAVGPITATTTLVAVHVVWDRAVPVPVRGGVGVFGVVAVVAVGLMAPGAHSGSRRSYLPRVDICEDAKV